MARDEIRERLALWMENMLDPREMAEVEARLLDSEAYRREYEKMQELDRLFSAAPMAEPSPGFARRFEARLRRQRKQRRTRRQVFALSFLIVAGLILSGIVAAGSGLALLDFWSNISQLGELVSLTLETISGIRAVVNTGLLIGRALLSVLGQPIFTGYLLLTAGLLSLWMQLVRRFTWSQRTLQT
ncbi:MAG: anti-sigma factor family protein [Anaerolineae bacterium]